MNTGEPGIMKLKLVALVNPHTHSPSVGVNIYALRTFFFVDSFFGGYNMSHTHTPSRTHIHTMYVCTTAYVFKENTELWKAKRKLFVPLSFSMSRTHTRTGEHRLSQTASPLFTHHKGYWAQSIPCICECPVARKGCAAVACLIG